jgi:hypothetical protein
VEKTGKERPWKSQERFPLSHSSNNNKLLLDDRDQLTAGGHQAPSDRLVPIEKMPTRAYLLSRIALKGTIKAGIRWLLECTSKNDFAMRGSETTHENSSAL